MALLHKELKTFLWSPYKADISEFIKYGENEITVELVNNCRNLLGPHLHKVGEIYTLYPFLYKDLEHWIDDYCLVKLGLARLIIDIY